jgi:hypothetical protein
VDESKACKLMAVRKWLGSAMDARVVDGERRGKKEESGKGGRRQEGAASAPSPAAAAPKGDPCRCRRRQWLALCDDSPPAPSAVRWTMDLAGSVAEWL